MKIKKTDIKISVEETRQMTEHESEVITALLFGWWKREYEQQSLFELRQPAVSVEKLQKVVDEGNGNGKKEY